MTPPLRVRDVTIARGGRTLLEAVSFDVAAGELVALMGPSGAGKSSLLRAIAGLDPLAHGTIEAARVGMVFQFHHLFEHLTVLDNVCLAPVLACRQPAAVARRRAADLLAALGVGARAAALPRELSGGEAQRVAIARALAVDPPVLLMDEPTASLDAERRVDLLATLRALVASGERSILVATHDAAVAGGADRVLCLDGGRLTATRMPAPAPVE